MTYYWWDNVSESFVFEIFLEILTKTFIVKHMFWAHFCTVFLRTAQFILCIYSKQTRIAVAQNTKYICWADEFVFSLRPLPDTGWLEKKM